MLSGTRTPTSFCERSRTSCCRRPGARRCGPNRHSRPAPRDCRGRLREDWSPSLRAHRPSSVCCPGQASSRAGCYGVLGKRELQSTLTLTSSYNKLRPRLACPSPAPALEGCILQDGTSVLLARRDTDDRHAIAQIRGRKIDAHLTGLVSRIFKVAVSQLPHAIPTPALYRAVGQDLHRQCDAMRNNESSALDAGKQRRRCDNIRLRFARQEGDPSLLQAEHHPSGWGWRRCTLHYPQVPVPGGRSVPNISRHLGLREHSCGHIPRQAAPLQSLCRGQPQGAPSPSRRARRHASPSVSKPSLNSLGSAPSGTKPLRAGLVSQAQQMSFAEALHAAASKQSAGVVP